MGGLISSTLLDFFVHPALFWTLGLRSARRVVESDEQEISLDTEPVQDADHSPSSEVLV